MKELKDRNIPYKIYLTEDEMPKYWYNVRADMTNKPAPLLNPGTLKPMTAQELGGVFCAELVKQEMDDTTAYFEIPEDIRNFYKMYRPSPLVRAYCLEEKLQTPAKIYYKFEGNNTSGSHKLNSAIAQAYYAKQQGLKGVTTETGAGQWGTALSMACAYLGLDCRVFMVKCSYEQKPFRREVMRTYGANVTPSPSNTTEIGRKILAEFPGTTGSLGCAISEAVEAATTREGYRYVLGSVLNQVLLHQSVIGLETQTALEKYGIKDANNMGAAMAPAAIDTLQAHFRDLRRVPSDYDLIVTGDLGMLGRTIVLDQFRRIGVDLSPVYNDCGLLIFDTKSQDVHAGGSGCGCGASVLCGYLLDRLEKRELRRLLFCATGALLSPTSSWQGESIPGVCHAVAITAEGV